ncbi:hypothetical protein ACJMK2_028492, partial [Sinanodonta woodiana]
ANHDQVNLGPQSHEFLNVLAQALVFKCSHYFLADIAEHEWSLKVASNLHANDVLPIFIKMVT